MCTNAIRTFHTLIVLTKKRAKIQNVQENSKCKTIYFQIQLVCIKILMKHLYKFVVEFLVFLIIYLIREITCAPCKYYSNIYNIIFKVLEEKKFYNIKMILSSN